MSKVNRRNVLVATAAAGALSVLPCSTSDLLAQGPIQFKQLQLNSGGQARLSRAVTGLDKHEDQLLDDLLSGNQQNEIRDLNDLSNDFTNLMNNPGNTMQFAGFNQGEFQRDVQSIQRSINLTRNNRNFGWGGIQGVVKNIDFFVGHWYPCNDIQEIGVIEAKVWRELNAPRPRAKLLNYYFQHMVYEMEAVFQFHRARNARFNQQQQQLFGLCRTYSNDLGIGNLAALKFDFQKVTTATDLFFRHHYPQWC